MLLILVFAFSGMTIGFAESPPMEHPSLHFSDVPDTHPYADDILSLAEKGIVKGDGSGFAPDRILTAAEAITMLERMYGNPESLPDWAWWSYPEYPENDHQKETVKSWSNIWMWDNEEFYSGKPYYHKQITVQKAIYMLLEITDINLPGYEKKNSSGTVSDSIYMMAFLGYPIDTYDEGNAERLITRGEFAHLLVWLYNRIISEQAVFPNNDAINSVPVKFCNQNTTKGNLTTRLYWIQAQLAMAYLPNTILDSFTQQGYTLKIMDTYTWVRQEPDHVSSSGVFSVTNKEICIRSNCTNTMLHEFGHFASKYTDGSKIAAEEILARHPEEIGAFCKAIGRDYPASSISEFVAEAFSLYLTNPKSVWTTAPDICPLLDHILSRFGEALPEEYY